MLDELLKVRDILTREIKMCNNPIIRSYLDTALVAVNQAIEEASSDEEFTHDSNGKA
jgi:hypothetical protein